jgi:hypothetical protein
LGVGVGVTEGPLVGNGFGVDVGIVVGDSVGTTVGATYVLFICSTRPPNLNPIRNAKKVINTESIIIERRLYLIY